ncbi:hypothetical protein [Pseudomonas chlororaphis]|nr:hypothetical protein [Pseudomonas chlororaphis]
MSEDNFTRLGEVASRTVEAVDHVAFGKPDATIGLTNLLDLDTHEIVQEEGRQVHRLTFKSGHSVTIEANDKAVEVKGARLSIIATTQAVLLHDPAQPVPAAKLAASPTLTPPILPMGGEHVR